jgi:SAM-dependent methyltransferase
MSKKNEYDNFDQFAQDYRVTHGKQTQLLGVESDYFADFKIKEIAGREAEVLDNPIKILDYGCGDGVAESFFLKYFPNAQVIGIDVSDESIQIAKKRNLPNATYTSFAGGNIPFKSGSFDVIFVAMVLHHINHASHECILIEFYRLLAPGGRIYIFEHNLFNPVTRYFVNTCPFDKDAHLVSPFSLKSQLKKLGFINVVNSYIFFFPRLAFFKPLLFIENHLKWFFLGGQYYSRATKP